MRIRPILLDSRPTCLRGPARAESLLLFPLGRHLVIDQLCAELEPITTYPPVVLLRCTQALDDADRIRGACPRARVVSTDTELVNEIGAYELSDGLLVIDPRCLPLRADECLRLVDAFSAEPRIAHHLVNFEGGVAGTKERVSFDSEGLVRGIVRHYDPATWSFIAGVAATLLPVASGILGDGAMPSSLVDLRQTLTARGIPSRDVPIQGGVIDLTEEAGIIAATKYFARKAVTVGGVTASRTEPLYVGKGHSIHATARVTGPVVLHDGAEIAEGAMVVGPAVIGARAKVSSGAVVAHAVIGPDCSVPARGVVCDRVWYEPAPSARSVEPLTYAERLAQVAIETRVDSARDGDESERLPKGVSAPFKRALDICVAAGLLIAFSPLLVLVALAVWIESGAPIFYGDAREGLGSRVFRCWKFRTMRVGAHAAQVALKAIDKMDGPHFKLESDPRVTHVGRVLRALNLDELPQLFNVLRGEMSLVGPRPSPFRENQVCVPWREARLSVRPGITGFWQVCRHDRSSGDFHQWIEYDLLYVQNISFWLDLKIIAATVLTLGGKAGHVPAKWLVSAASRELPVRPEDVRRATAKTEQVVTT